MTQAALMHDTGADPYDTGARVLAALEAGRDRVNTARKARARALADLVAAEAERDRALGLPARGRPARIARRLRISRRHAYRICAALFSESHGAL